MIVPCGHRVLVKAEKIEDIDPMYKRAQAAGIQLADTEDKRREQAGLDKGTVVALGPTAFRDFGGDPWCSVGDFIVFAKYAGKGVTDGEDQYIVLNDEDVVAIMRKDDV